MTVLEQLVRLPAWHRYAACHGQTELFYGELELEQRIALAVCRGCGVREDCLAEALDEERLLGPGSVHGTRGGMTARERARLLP